MLLFGKQICLLLLNQPPIEQSTMVARSAGTDAYLYLVAAGEDFIRHLASRLRRGGVSLPFPPSPIRIDK